MYQDLVLSSGYTVRVRGSGPFALDEIGQRYPELDPVVRVIQLAAGDVGEWPYTLPDVPPTRDDDVEEYELWARYQSREWENTKNRLARLRGQSDFFKRNSIEVIGSPYFSLYVIGLRIGTMIRRWAGRVAVPPSTRYIRFLDQEVVRSTDDWQQIMNRATIPEVTMRGILDASRRFPGDVGGEPADGAGVERVAAERGE